MSQLALVAIALCVITATASPCRSYGNCQECLGDGLFCGWCSPSPVVFNNGTLGFQCQDQHESGWHCNHEYSTATCLPGYACNGTTGQCYITEAGKGDTKENCEASCHITPKPKGLSVCNVQTKTCEPCTEYCNTDSDCPGSYCQVGLCHGSTCETNSTCSSQCTSDTPDELVGIWRGILISNGFTIGEYDFKFQKKAAGPGPPSQSQVQFKGPGGKISSGSLETDGATGGHNMMITYTDGPLAGSKYSGAYDPWEPSSETLQTAFYFGAASEPKPVDIATAMAGSGQTAYVMSLCNPHTDKQHCDFSSTFQKKQGLAALAEFLTAMVAAPSDPCSKHLLCGPCIGDATGLCGWCDKPVTYEDNTTGTQCAGFDSTGKPLGWVCNGVFHKDQCMDYGCDWTDIKNPKCAECSDAAICKVSKDDCETDCVPPSQLYSCDEVTKKCEPCASNYCTNDSECPDSYCQKSGLGPWSCHGWPAAGCVTNSSCAASCGTPEKQDYYVCDQFSGQCVNVTKGTPGADTKYTCEHECRSAAPIGTWRGVQVSMGYQEGEFDITFYDDATVHWRTPSADVFVAKFEGLNLTKAEDGTMPVSGTITASDDSKALPVGTAVYASYKVDAAGNDGIAQLLFWAISTKGPIASLDEGMLEAEFVLVGCDVSMTACDFSSAVV